MQLDKFRKVLITPARVLKKNYDNKLTSWGDEFQVSLKYKKLTKFHDKPQIPVYNRYWQFVLNICFYIEDTKKYTYQFLFLIMLGTASA